MPSRESETNTTTPPSKRVDHAIETELLGRDSELAVERQDEKRIELSGSDQFRDVRHIDEKKRLE